MCDFLLVFHCNYVPAFYRFPDIMIYWWKICIFSPFLPTLVSFVISVVSKHTTSSVWAVSHCVIVWAVWAVSHCVSCVSSHTLCHLCEQSHIVSSVWAVSHCVICVSSHTLCHLCEQSHIVSSVWTVSHCVICVSSHTLCHLCEQSHIVSSVWAVSHCVICVNSLTLCHRVSCVSSLTLCQLCEQSHIVSSVCSSCCWTPPTIFMFTLIVTSSLSTLVARFLLISVNGFNTVLYVCV